MLKNCCFFKNISFYLHVLFFYYIILAVCVSDTASQSEVTLSIRAGGSGLIGVGIEFEPTDGSMLITEVENTLTDDLNYCGIFQVKEIPDSVQNTSQSLFAMWQAADASCLVFGKETRSGSSVSIEVIDLKTAVTLLQEESDSRGQAVVYRACNC